MGKRLRTGLMFCVIHELPARDNVFAGLSIAELALLCTAKRID